MATSGTGMTSSFLLLIFFAGLGIRATIFTRPHKLAVLFFKEEELVRRLRKVFQKAHIKPAVWKEYLESVDARNAELEPLSNLKDEDKVHSHMDQVLHLLAGNPIHVFCLLDRLVNLLPDILKGVGLGSSLLGDDMPGLDDFKHHMLSLARIQHVYQLNPMDLARGNIMGIMTKARLSQKQLMAIARSRIKDTQCQPSSPCHPLRPPPSSSLGREYALALEWGEAALGMAMGEEERRGATAFVEEMRRQHDIHWRSPVDQRGNFPNEEFFLRKTEGRISADQLRKEEEGQEKTGEAQIRRQAWHIQDYHALCRGKPVTPSTAPKLPLCRLVNNDDLFFLLGPLKQEEISLDPLLLLYHDFLTDHEMSYMVDKIMPDLEAASVQDVSDSGGGGQKVSMERSQASGWLWDQDHPLLESLSRRTERLTGLEISRDPRIQNITEKRIVEAEAWQLGVYSPGGHYLPHYDSFDILDPQSRTPKGTWVGNRIATVMFYLSDVMGGRTAFPKMGLSIKPRRGTAVFWYNLHSDGERDERSIHGACPTVLGIKWVSNKWVREGSQIWKYPCL